MDARYRFAVRFRLSPPEGVSVEPAEFETALYYAAPPLGEDGWMFFRDHLWRGELSDPDHFRGLAEEALGVAVVAVEFRAFETDREYLDALWAAIGDSLEAFRADSVTEATNKYLGSAIEVREPEDS